MYRTHIVIVFAMLIFVFIGSLICDKVIGIYIRETLMQNFITFLSIVLGFYTASISALYGSKYLGKICSVIDVKNDKNLLIHTLQSYFKISIYVGLFTMIFLFVVSMVSVVANSIFVLNAFVKACIISIIFLNLLLMYFVTKILIAGLLIEGKEVSKKS